MHLETLEECVENSEWGLTNPKKLSSTKGRGRQYEGEITRDHLNDWRLYETKIHT